MMLWPGSARLSRREVQRFGLPRPRGVLPVDGSFQTDPGDMLGSHAIPHFRTDLEWVIAYAAPAVNGDGSRTMH